MHCYHYYHYVVYMHNSTNLQLGEIYAIREYDKYYRNRSIRSFYTDIWFMSFTMINKRNIEFRYALVIDSSKPIASISLGNLSLFTIDTVMVFYDLVKSLRDRMTSRYYH